MRRLYIIARLEILHFKHGRRQSIFSVIAVAEIRIAVDDACQFSSGQVRGEALKALSDMCLAPNNVKHREQLADCAGIDITSCIACVHRADEVVIDRQPECQMMLFLQFTQQGKFLDDASVQRLFDRIKRQQQIAV